MKKVISILLILLTICNIIKAQLNSNETIINGTLVFLSSNQFAASQRLLLCKVDDNGVVNVNDERVTYSDIKGKFSFKGIPIGNYVIFYGLKEIIALNSKEPLRISVNRDGERISLGTLKVNKGASITGILIDKTTLKPISNVQLVLCPIQEIQDSIVRYSMNFSLISKTNNIGNFKINSIPPGNYSLMTSVLSGYTCSDPNNCYVVMRCIGKVPFYFYRITDNSPVRVIIKTGNEQINIGRIATY
jgi:hypothetical protein